MTGYQSKKAAALDEEGMYLVHHTKRKEERMTIAWYDPTNHHVSTDKNDPMFTPLGQLWPLVVQQEQNFCPRCGKRTQDIHTCTPPQENT